MSPSRFASTMWMANGSVDSFGDRVADPMISRVPNGRWCFPTVALYHTASADCFVLSRLTAGVVAGVRHIHQHGVFCSFCSAWMNAASMNQVGFLRRPSWRCYANRSAQLSVHMRVACVCVHTVKGEALHVFCLLSVRSIAIRTTLRRSNEMYVTCWFKR